MCTLKLDFINMVAFYITRQMAHRQWDDFKTVSIINNLSKQINSTNKGNLWIFNNYSLERNKLTYLTVHSNYRKKTKVNYNWYFSFCCCCPSIKYVFSFQTNFFTLQRILSEKIYLKPKNHCTKQTNNLNKGIIGEKWYVLYSIVFKTFFYITNVITTGFWSSHLIQVLEIVPVHLAIRLDKSNWIPLVH